ncbi:MAG: ADP-ribosylation factor-like protein, partial [Candidatus Hodarchaeales archaeon]
QIGHDIQKIINKLPNRDPISKLPIIREQIQNYLLNIKFITQFELPIIKEAEKLKLIPIKEISERIVFFGLAKAGKSSIVESFFNRKNHQELEHIPPTMGMKTIIPNIPFSDRSIQVIDLGGHRQFIDSHLKTESLFTNTMNLILVIDSKNIDKLHVAIKYFKQVLKIISKKSSHLPVISIFLHKFDPSDSSIPQKFLWELSQTLFPELSTLGINWAIYQTSIYNQKLLDSAMVDSFLRALPQDYISQTMELNDFLAAFDSLLPMTVSDKSNVPQIIDKTLEKKIFSAAVDIGKDFGLSIKDKWINYVITGEKIESTNSKASVFANIERIGRDLKFNLIWPLPGQITEWSYFPTVFQGLLTGILSYCGSYQVERECQEFNELSGQFHCEFWGRKT